MSVNSDINKKEDIKTYINKIVEELINTNKLYKGIIREEKVNGIYKNIKIEFQKIREEDVNK